jgi:hypothetical protein
MGHGIGRDKVCLLFIIYSSQMTFPCGNSGNTTHASWDTAIYTWQYHAHSPLETESEHCHLHLGPTNWADLADCAGLASKQCMIINAHRSPQWASNDCTIDGKCACATGRKWSHMTGGKWVHTIGGTQSTYPYCPCKTHHHVSLCGTGPVVKSEPSWSRCSLSLWECLVVPGKKSEMDTGYLSSWFFPFLLA